MKKLMRMMRHPVTTIVELYRKHRWKFREVMCERRGHKYGVALRYAEHLPALWVCDRCGKKYRD
jgi:RNA:NAD 2'-phosphotransferase (TPT1/KptA family)